MTIGKEPRPTEKIIGNSVFSITLFSIQEILSKLKKDLLQVNDAFALTEEDFAKQFPDKESAKRTHDIFKRIKLRNEAVVEVSPEEILQALQEIYNFAIELEKKGFNKKGILLKIKNEKHMIELVSKYGVILEDTDWGTNINHGLLHV